MKTIVQIPLDLTDIPEAIETARLAVRVPVQAVGCLSVEQADAFRTAGGDLEGKLRKVCEAIHAYGDVPVGQ